MLLVLPPFFRLAPVLLVAPMISSLKGGDRPARSKQYRPTTASMTSSGVAWRFAFQPCDQRLTTHTTVSERDKQTDQEGGADAPVDTKSDASDEPAGDDTWIPQKRTEAWLDCVWCGGHIATLSSYLRQRLRIGSRDTRPTSKKSWMLSCPNALKWSGSCIN